MARATALSAVVVIDSDVSVLRARRETAALAALRGLSARETQELVLVVSELASNILKYGARGAIHVELSAERARFVAEDEGPTFDLATASADGHDARGAIDPASLYGRRGLGLGLGAITRLSDSVRLEPHPGGKRIVVERRLAVPPT